MVDTDFIHFLIQYVGKFTWPKRWSPEAFLTAVHERQPPASLFYWVGIKYIAIESAKERHNLSSLMHRARTENQVNLAMVKLRDRFLSRSGKRAMATTLPQVPQEMRSPSCTFAQQDDPENVLTHGTPRTECMVRAVVCASTFANLRDFLKAVFRKLEAAAGCEVLPTLTGRCVETPGRLLHALSLAAASERRTEGCSLVSS